MKQTQKPVESSCCATEAKPVETSCCATEAKVEESSCCDTASQQAKPINESWLSKAWDGIYYAFTRLLDDIVLWLVVGMLFAAASKTFIPTDFLAQWGQGIPAMLVMIAAGIPMYICTTASTPVAAGLLMAGVSPGVALVLLLTGPATNISTLGIISKELGKRSMWLYLTGVVVTAIVAGLVTDALVDAFQIDVLTQVHEGHGGLPTWLGWAALVFLIAVVFRKFVIGQIPVAQPSN